MVLVRRFAIILSTFSLLLAIPTEVEAAVRGNCNSPCQAVNLLSLGLSEEIGSAPGDRPHFREIESLEMASSEVERLADGDLPMPTLVPPPPPSRQPLSSVLLERLLREGLEPVRLCPAKSSGSAEERRNPQFCPALESQQGPAPGDRLLPDSMYPGDRIHAPF
jgi:hypothetical protein